MAKSLRVALILAVYALSLSALLGTSALYHRLNWNPKQRAWMRRLDHTMIFVLIAGTYTPFSLLSIGGDRGVLLSLLVWLAALLGLLLNLLWINAPKWLSAILYVALGWVGIEPLFDCYEQLGSLFIASFLLGGVLYTLGALIYALKRPNPLPQIFGYHEIFHALVLLAAAVHYAAILLLILPDAR